MRIASTQYHSTMNQALQNVSGETSALMQKMSSGLRLLHPSDDPITSVRLLRLTREEAALNQYRDNIGALKSRLQNNEAYLDGMQADLLQVRDHLVWAADGANSPADLQAMASPLKALRDSLFYTANTRDQEGRYLFSGTATATAAISYDPDAEAGQRYRYDGDTEQQLVVVGNDITESANVSLPELARMLNQLDGTIAKLDAPDLSVADPTVRRNVADSLDCLDLTVAAISSKIAGLGGANNTLDTMDANHGNVSLSNQQAMLTLGELDYAEASVNLNSYMIALQATQKTYGKVSNLSLFDVI